MRWALWIGLFLSTVATALPSRPFSHDALDRILQAYVDSTGRVDYAALKVSRTLLDAYIDSLGGTSPRNHPERFPTRAHELAYWINAYNAFVLRGVIDAYPVGSVEEIGGLDGFFRRKRFIAGGAELTLDDLENQIIRPVYQDPRIHFAINCGALGCPFLAQRAFTGEDLDARLEEALSRFARHPQYVRLDPQTGQLHLSRILEWYGQDFVQWFPQNRREVPEKPTIEDYLLPYLPAETAAYLRQHPGIQIVYNDYDWALNNQAVPP